MKNNNITPCKQRFNIKNTKKCGAKTRNNEFCQSPAMRNGRCRLHGGKSTGARTKQGIERIRNANLKSGFYTKEMITDRKFLSNLLKQNKSFISEILS